MRKLFLFFVFFTNIIFADDALDVIKKADQLLRGKTNFSELTMTIKREKWSRQISMKAWVKGYDYSLIVITSPPKDKGTVFLKRKNEIWSFLPSIQKNIKIPPSMMGQSWMGSDFTNDDLVKESSIVHDYVHKIIKIEKIGDFECYKIEMIPKPMAPVVWGKILVWIDIITHIQHRVEFYDEEAVIINTMLASNIKKMGGRLIPSKLIMIPEEKPGNQTILVYQEIIFNENIEDSFFSFRNMKKISYEY